MGYTYVVFTKGERPVAPSESSSHEESEIASSSHSANGRMGGVGKEELEKARVKVQGQSVLREVEGGGYEMVSLAEVEGVQAGSSTEESSSVDVDYASLRKEAYSWPRLIAPPIKRSGHVVMDVCSPNGMSLPYSSMSISTSWLHPVLSSPDTVAHVQVRFNVRHTQSPTRNKDTTTRVRPHGVIFSHTPQRESKSSARGV